MSNSIVTKYGKSFTILPNTFIMNPNISSDAKCLMLVLQQYAWTSNEVFPAVDTLLYHLNWGRTRYNSARKELVDKGFMEVQRQKNEKGIFEHNLYILDPEHIYEELPTDTEPTVGLPNHGEHTTNNTNIYNKTNINNNTNINNIPSKQKTLFTKTNPYDEIISYLNSKNNSKYKSTTKKTRDMIDKLFSDGYTLEDFKYVIDIKYEEWRGTEWIKYLCPDTLFKPDKFEKYLNQQPVKRTKNTTYHFDGEEANSYNTSNSRRL